MPRFTLIAIGCLSMLMSCISSKESAEDTAPLGNSMDALNFVSVRVDNALDEAVSCQAIFENNVALDPTIVSVQSGQSEELFIGDLTYAVRAQYTTDEYLREGLRVDVRCVTASNTVVDGDSFNTQETGYRCLVTPGDSDAALHCE